MVSLLIINKPVDTITVIRKIGMALPCATPGAFGSRAKLWVLGEEAMTSVIDFFFDFSSAYSYAGEHRIRMLEADNRAKGSWKPICPGEIVQQRGHSPEHLNSVKGLYVKKNVEYCAKESSVFYQWPSPFPINSIFAARLFYYLENLLLSLLLDQKFA